jgi:hypothetical protein
MARQGTEHSKISRWSERKLAAERTQSGEDSAAAPTAKSADDRHGVEPISGAELQANCAAAQAVDLETLDENSDFSVFMKQGVPGLLRKQAMAALWRSSPVFANIDGLVDYDDDFGSADLILKTFESSWQAGRGYLQQAEGQGELAEAPAKTVAEAPLEAHESEPDPIDQGRGSEHDEGNLDPLAGVADDEQTEITDETGPVPEKNQRVSLRSRLILDDNS